MNLMLVGLPACGKSSFTKTLEGYAIISTDKTREFLYGSEEIQGEWPEVFEDISLQFSIARACGLPVCYDATNLLPEHRESILGAFPGPWKAIVFTNDPWDCWKRNCRRYRTVPGYAFNAMVAGYKEPTLSEGFEEIFFTKG